MNREKMWQCLFWLALLSPLTLSVYAQEVAEKKPDSSSEVGNRLHIHFDQPTFRRIYLSLATKNLEASRVEVTKAREVNVSLKRFMGELSKLLRFSTLFFVHTPVLYTPPFFPWPKKEQTLENWLSEKPEVSLKGGRKMDGTVMAEVTEDPEGKRQYRFLVVDLVTYKVRFEKTYTFSGTLPRATLKEWSRELADEILSQFTGSGGFFSSRLVFAGRKTEKSPKHIYTARVDGSDLKQISTGTSIHLSPSWSRSGEQILYTSYKSGDPDLYLYDVLRRSTRKLSAYPGIDSGGQSDPKSDYVALSGVRQGDTDIYFTTLSGAPRKPLIRGHGLDVDPTFSPDGRWLAFVSGRFGNPHIFLAELDRSSQKSLRVKGDRRLTFAGWYNASPAFSPDSKKIAFAGYDREINRFDLFLMDWNGRNLERLTLRTGDNESPSWSPKGQFIVFESNRVGTADRKGPSALYLMRKDGSAQQKIPIPLYAAYSPKWSP